MKMLMRMGDMMWPDSPLTDVDTCRSIVNHCLTELDKIFSLTLTPLFLTFPLLWLFTILFLRFTPFTDMTLFISFQCLFLWTSKSSSKSIMKCQTKKLVSKEVSKEVSKSDPKLNLYSKYELVLISHLFWLYLLTFMYAIVY